MAVIPEQGSIHNAKAANAGVQLADIPRIDVNKLIAADGGREKLAGLVKRKKPEEDEFQNTGDDVGVTTEEVAAAQDSPMLLAQAETAGAEAASSAAGGGAAGTGAASGGAASAGTAAGGAAGAETAAGLAFSDAALGTMILAGTVGVAAIASGGGSAAAVAPTVGFTLSGLIALGQVNSNTGLVLEAFKADGTALLVSSSVVNTNGTFTITITENYNGPVLLRLKDTTAATDYFDEGSGAAKDITTDLRAVVTVSGSGGANITVAITPLTELATRQLLGDSGGDAGSSATTLGAATTSQAVTDANNSVKTAFGLTSDIVTTTPVTVDNTAATGATTAQLAYGQVLAAISGMETVQAVSSGQVLGQLSQAIVPTAAGAASLSASAADLLVQGAQQVQTAAAATPANYLANTDTTLASAVTASVGTSITGLTLSSDTGLSNKDFITNSAAAQTVAGTLGGALGTNLLWGSLDNGTSWTDITLTAVNGTALSWSVGVLTGAGVIQLAQTTSTATATTVAANLVTGTKVVVQSYVVDAAAPTAPTVAAVAGAADATAAEATTGAAAVTAENLSTVAVTFTGTAGAVTKTVVGNGAAQAVALSAADLTALGEGAVAVSAVATDIAGNASAAGAGAFNLDTVVPVITSAATASVAENTAQATAVYTAAATDTNALAYTLGGADAALFNIDAATGAVTFKASPNFEAPGSAAASNAYTIAVTATDVAGNATTQTVTIDVTNVNETPTLTSLGAVSLAENGTGVAYTVTATDPDAGAVLTYALAGADAALFSINASTGAVSFVDPLGPNFEAQRSNVYNIDVTASDGTITTAAQAVAITVTNVNEAPTVIAQNGPPTQVFAVNQPIPAQTSVAAMFVDPDANTGPTSFGALTYTSTGLPVGITLDPVTGVISGTPTTTVTAAPVTITATDAGGLSVSHSMTVDVVTAPVITGLVANVLQATSGNALTFTATISEAVTVTQGGTPPTLTLDVGGTAMTATYTGAGATPNTLTFSATAPATGDSAAVTVTAINLNGGTIIGNLTTQPLVAATTGQVVSSFVVDNSAPVLAGAATVNYAENDTAAVYATTFTDATALTYSALSGVDASKFSITNGALSFINSPNFEAPTDAGTPDNIYNVTVTATDALGHATTQALTINVTNVNEAPALNGTPTPPTFAVGQQITANNNVTGMFVDPEGGALTYVVTGLPAGITFDSATNLVTGTPTTTGTTNVTFTATDAALNSTSHTMAVSVVAAPTLTSTIDNVANFDVSSNIVLTASEAVTGVAGKFIRIVNDANDVTNAGFHGETTANTQTIDAAAVTIVGKTITINPGFDLDLSNNYHIEVDAGAFIGATSGMGSIAVTDPLAMNFSTVTPGAATGGVAGAVASQQMVSGTDAMAASYSWWDIQGLGSTITSTAVAGDLAAGNIAVVIKDYDPAAGNANIGYTGIGSPGDGYVNLLNFGTGDLLYIDNQTNAAVNDLTQASIGNSGVAPNKLIIDGYTPQGGFPTWVEVTTTQGTTGVFSDVAGFQSLLSLTYVPIVSA
jgi:hypothetical protein